MLSCKRTSPCRTQPTRLSVVAWLVVLGFLVTVLRTSDVEAYRIIVRYDPTDQPPTLTQTRVVRAIQSVMREFETLGAGKVVLEWGGVSVNRVVGTGNIAIYWDRSTPYCADIYAFWAAPLWNGALRLHPDKLNSVDFPNPNVGCGGLRDNLMHELAHYFEQTTPAHHEGWDSVLNWGSGGVRHTWFAGQTAAGYRPMYHLWNNDFQWFPCGVWGKLSFCPHATSAVVRDYNSTTTAVTTMSQFPVERPATTAIATGGPGFSYALVASNAYTTWVNQGSGASWSLTATINEGSFHRKCLATSVYSNDMLMAWPNRTEEMIPGWAFDDSSAFDVERVKQIGARSIRYTMSHDGGHTWDPVQNMPLPGVLTRNGISCGWNPARARFVIAWQSATNEEVQFAERDLVGAWRIQNPSVLAGALVPRTHEPPNLYFDPFGDGTGVLVWQAAGDLETRMARINYNAGVDWYQLGETAVRDACGGSNSCELTIHYRNLLVPSTMDGFPHEAYSYAWLVGTAGLQYRLRRRDTWPIATVANSFDSNTTPAASSSLSTYQQFAEDRIFVRRALLETQVASVE